MSKTTVTTVDKILGRLDVLAAKLGVAAKEIWRFSVSAKVVEAKSNLAKSFGLLLLAVIFTGWATRVAFMKIPHETRQEPTYAQTNWEPCTQTQDGHVHTLGNCYMEMHEEKPILTTVDDGISNYGYGLLISGGVAGILAFFFWTCSVEGIIDALADLHTTEYDAYQDIIYDWKD